MAIRLHHRTLLTLSLIGVFGYVVIEAWDMPAQARLFPLTIGAIALALLALQLFREVLLEGAKGKEASGADMDFTEEEASAEGRRRTFETFGWIFGLALGLWLLGFYTAIPLMVFLYLLRHREKPVLVVALPLGTWAATWGVFDRLLHLPFPPGVLIEWLGLR
jgi:hypothetical protein